MDLSVRPVTCRLVLDPLFQICTHATLMFAILQLFNTLSLASLIAISLSMHDIFTEESVST